MINILLNYHPDNAASPWAMMETGRHLKPIRGLSGTGSEPVAVRKDAPTRISFRSEHSHHQSVNVNN